MAKQLKHMREAELARAALQLLVDFPTLKLAHVVDEQGRELSPLDRPLLITLFRDNKAPLAPILDFSRKCIGSSLSEVYSYDDPQKATAQVIANLSFAEALLERAVQRGAKAHVWGQSARLLHEHVDAIPGEPPYKTMLYDMAGSWYRKTIAGKGDGQYAAMYGLGLLIYTHDKTGGETATQTALQLFKDAASNGNTPAMDALADLAIAPDAIHTTERQAALTAILSGIKRAPQDTASIADKLLGAGLIEETAPAPQRPGHPLAARAERLVIKPIGPAA